MQKNTTKKDLKTFKIVDVDFKNGWTITLLNKNELRQHYISLVVIEKFFGGNK